MCNSNVEVTELQVTVWGVAEIISEKRDQLLYKKEARRRYQRERPGGRAEAISAGSLRLHSS